MPAPREKLNLAMVIGFWALIAAIYAVRAFVESAETPLFLDSDDAMRLVVVRDFLNGQGWYDIVQHRLNVPYGAEIHWSRLIDLPLAMILAGLELVVAPGIAETILGYLWPSLMLLVLLWLSARLTLDLVGREGLLPALVLPALAPAVMQQFVPGRLDHHGAQIILALVLVLCTIRAIREPRWAIGAGLAAATALAIGTEAIPGVAAAILAFGFLWAFRPERADALRGFGISFALATLVHLAIALPPERWLVPMCDAISPVYAMTAVIVGALFVVLPVLPVRGAVPAIRLAWGIVLGAGGIAILVALFPMCLRGPYAAVDPWLVDNWLNRILEARPVWESFRALPTDTVAIALPPIIGLAVAVWCAMRADRNRESWWVLALTLAIAVAVMVVQVRGARFAAPLAVPAAAWLIAAARAHYLATRRLPAVGGLVGSWLISSGVAVLAIGMGVMLLLPRQEEPADARPATTEVAARKEACLLPSAFDDLRALPPERIMTPIDLGSHTLMETPHAVVSAPYHRNQQGVRDTFRFFNEPLADVRQILTARGVGLVVTCPAMAEMQGGPGTDPDSFVALEKAGALPGWLIDQSLPGAPLKVFAVLPE